VLGSVLWKDFSTSSIFLIIVIKTRILIKNKIELLIEVYRSSNIATARSWEESYNWFTACHSEPRGRCPVDYWPTRSNEQHMLCLDLSQAERVQITSPGQAPRKRKQNPFLAGLAHASRDAFAPTAPFPRCLHASAWLPDTGQGSNQGTFAGYHQESAATTQQWVA
jgi:hypothetical protein